MAQIKLNATYGLTGTLPAVSGANLTTLNASNVSSGTLNAARYSGGKVLQVIQSTNNTYKEITTTTMTDTGLSGSITPSSSSNKVLVMTQQSLFVGWQYHTLICAKLSINRSIGGASYSAIFYNDRAIAQQADKYSGDRIATSQTVPYFYLDSPSTTSAITYKTMYGLTSTSNNATTRVNDYDTTQNISRITLMEIAA